MMTKASKLLNTPGLFVKDAFKNILGGRSKEIINAVNTTPTIEIITETPLLKYDNEKLNIHLIVIDTISDKIKFKESLIRYQYRSIIKYTNFKSLSYISQSIISNNSDISVFKNYSDAFKNKIRNISPKRELFIFIDLNFLFLKKVTNKDFISPTGIPYTFIKNKKRNIDRVKNTFAEHFCEFDYNFSPAEKFCCVDNMQLCHYNNILESVSNPHDYLFEFLPISNTMTKGEQSIIKSPIQFALLDRGYEEKFIWIQSVHGSKRCPLAVTFNKMNDKNDDYAMFLDTIVPHVSRDEHYLSVKQELSH